MVFVSKYSATHSTRSFFFSPSDRLVARGRKIKQNKKLKELNYGTIVIVLM